MSKRQSGKVEAAETMMFARVFGALKDGHELSSVISLVDESCSLETLELMRCHSLACSLAHWIGFPSKRLLIDFALSSHLPLPAKLFLWLNFEPLKSSTFELTQGNLFIYRRSTCQRCCDLFPCACLFVGVEFVLRHH